MKDHQPHPFKTPPRNTTFPFQRYTLIFQQHQDESLYDAWTRYKDLIQKVPHHGLNLWSQIQIFFNHIDRYTQIGINYAASENLRGLSAEEAWETIEDCAQCDKQWKNPTSTIFDQTIANLKDQLVGNEVVRVKIPSCMSWLDAYDEPLGDLDIMEDKVENQSPQSTLQVLPSFEENTSPVTYPDKVEEIIGIPIEVEPLDETPLEDLSLDTCNHDIPLSSGEIPNFDELKPQPQPLPSCPSLELELGEERDPVQPIKPPSTDSFRMKEVNHLTIYTPHSPYVASFHPKDMYFCYRPCVDDPKKHYGFKLGLLGHSGSLDVDFSKLGMIEDDWELESMEVSFLGRGLNSPVRPKKVEKVKIKETHQLEHKIQQILFQHMALSHNNDVYRYYYPHLNSSVGEPSPLSVK
ncbi:hypothetical protein Tco_0656468 [Tanacetum coccineum]|uniref:Retrotransposon gag domain-containing protein n=1 Tax=Tanacetum coccineum TaxID=301880 RepID=A0ABQ4X8V3_9ASTR